MWKHRMRFAIVATVLIGLWFWFKHYDLNGEVPVIDEMITVPVSIYITFVVFFMVVDLHFFELSRVQEIEKYRPAIVIGALSTWSYILTNLFKFFEKSY